MDLALFDFDGTITYKDSFAPFIRQAVNPRRMAIGIIKLLPILLGYKLHLVSSSVTRSRIVEFGFRGESEDKARGLGKAFALSFIPSIVRDKAIERIAWHRSRNDEVVVVSAAPNIYLEYWCQDIGVEVICSELESRNGLLTGRYIGGDCTGAEKVRRIRERIDLGCFSEVYAYGDTYEDENMLELATKKYFRWKEIHSINDIPANANRVDVDPDR